MAHDYRVQFDGTLPLAQAHADSFVFLTSHGVAAKADAFAQTAEQAQSQGHHHQHHHDHHHQVLFHGEYLGSHFLDHLSQAIGDTHIGNDPLFGARFPDYHDALA